MHMVWVQLPELPRMDDSMHVAPLTFSLPLPVLMCSAHWCPPCRGFTPQLAESYTRFKASSHPRRDDLSIVFVSSDRTQEAFDEYFAEMPWLALPFAERELKAKLSSKFKVSGKADVGVRRPKGVTAQL